MAPEQEVTWGESANWSGRELSEWMRDVLDSAVTGRQPPVSATSQEPTASGDGGRESLVDPARWHS